MARKKQINKLGSEDVPTSRWPIGAIGYDGLFSIQGQIFEESKKELRWPNSIRTFQQMSYDPIIGGSQNLIDIMINKVEWKFKAPEEGSEQSKQAAEFLNWCMNNMEGQTWMDFIQEVGSYRTYGYHVAEKVMQSITAGKWSGKFKWKKLATRAQITIKEWLWTDDKRKLIGLKQDLSRVGNDVRFKKPTPNFSDIIIPRNKFMLFRYGTRKDNPEGHSPLVKCYKPWKEKNLVEDYELIGAAKDLSGIAKIGVDVNYLSKATINPAGPEAANVDYLKKQGASLHQGEQNFVLVPLAYNDAGKELFTFNLLGVEGRGKQFDTDVIIKRKQGEILMAYLTDVLRLGTESHGSFSLADAKTSLLGHSIEYHLKIIKEVIDTDLIPYTLAVNGFYLNEDDMPRISYGDVESTDLDILSKFIQRVVSVGAMSVDQELDEALRKSAHLPVPKYEEKIPDDFLPIMQSKAGQGLQTTGPGTSKSPGGGDRSTSNNANKSSILSQETLDQIQKEMDE